MRNLRVILGPCLVALAALVSVVSSGLAEEPRTELDPGATAEEKALLGRLDDDELITARREAEALVKEHPDSIVGHYVLGRVLHAAEGSLPQAMRELGRARELYEARHPRTSDTENFRLHQQILYSTAWLALEMEEFEFQLQILDYHDELYNPRAAGEHAWPLLRLGRIDEARAFADLAAKSRQSHQRALGKNALCAIEGESERRDAYQRACLAALEEKRALPSKDPARATLAVDAYNASLAALANLRPDDAEKLALEGTRTFSPTTANPWRLLVSMRLSQGRTSDALDALREMLAWRRRSPANVRAQDRAKTDALAATVFLLANEAERGLALADGLLVYPDRRGLTTISSEQATGGHALLRRALRRAVVALEDERRSWGDPAAPSGFARFRLLLDRAFAARADEERIVKSLLDRRRLLSTLRAHLTRGLEDTPIWLAGDLVEVLGPGVVGAALDEARSEETRDDVKPYLDAVEAEVAWRAGDEERAVSLASRALEALPPTEALLRARTAAVAFAAHDDTSPRALGYLEQALSLDGGILRRLGRRVPARLELPNDPVGVALREHLERSPRLEVGAVGVMIRLDSNGPSPRVCLLGANTEAELRCATLAIVKDAQGKPVADTDAARALAALVHLELFAIPLGLSGLDVSSLDGSTVTGGAAVREKLERVLEADPQGAEP
ncbi:MAG: hypothetical protein FJ095_11155 [Deltaproteobacteria bacterium]|nr:hypothetical protein [Deltaproteobacteria bacterium]